MIEKKHIVVMGGGTGTFSVLSGLKRYADRVDLSAVVTTADSGGSTGRLRDQFGKLPVGDVRMAMLALADDERIDGMSLRELFLYRFDRGGEGLSGHNFGNLFLTALSDVVGGEREAIAIASRLLGLKGRVLPVTYDDVTLIAKYDDDKVLYGEDAIDVPPLDRRDHRITELSLKPKGEVSADASEAIESADLIILGPGDLYTSILATIVVGDMRERLMRARGDIVLVGNLMSKAGQTTGYDSAKYAEEIEWYAGRAPDYMLINDAPLTEVMRAAYTGALEDVVSDSGAFAETTTVLRGDYLAPEISPAREGDRLKRSLVRHDPQKLADAIIAIL